MSPQVRRFLPALGAITVLVLLSAAVSFYILGQERFRFPWQSVYTIHAEFPTAQAVTPGQGQTVTVSGVDVGEISGVKLKDGHAIVSMDMKPDKLRTVYANAHMLLRPRTALEDQTVALDPGTPAAPKLTDKNVLPVSNTEANVNLDQILAALDGDTRNYLQVLLDAGGQGLNGRAKALRKLFEAGKPTLQQVQGITTAINARRHELARLVHNLGVLSGAVSGHDTQLADLISQSNTTFGALANQDVALQRTFIELPSTLHAADSALSATQPFARTLRPALDALDPTTKALTPALKAVRPLLQEGPPELRAVARFATNANPLLQETQPTLADLTTSTPSLTSAFKTLRYVTNELAYNPALPAHGYMFWASWFAQDVNSIFSTGDAHGSYFRGNLLFSCSTVTGLAPIFPLLQQALSVVCP